MGRVSVLPASEGSKSQEQEWWSKKAELEQQRLSLLRNQTPAFQLSAIWALYSTQCRPWKYKRGLPTIPYFLVCPTLQWRISVLINDTVWVFFPGCEIVHRHFNFYLDPYWILIWKLVSNYVGRTMASNAYKRTIPHKKKTISNPYFFFNFEFILQHNCYRRWYDTTVHTQPNRHLWHLAWLPYFHFWFLTTLYKGNRHKQNAQKNTAALDCRYPPNSPRFIHWQHLLSQSNK